jgi:hypothetical protein
MRKIKRGEKKNTFVCLFFKKKEKIKHAKKKEKRKKKRVLGCEKDAEKERKKK